MRVFWFLFLVLAIQVDAQLWKFSQQFFNPFSWIRQGKTGERVSESDALPVLPAYQQSPVVAIPLLNSNTSTTMPTMQTPAAPPSSAAYKSSKSNQNPGSGLVATTKRFVKVKQNSTETTTWTSTVPTIATKNTPKKLLNNTISSTVLPTTATTIRVTEPSSSSGTTLTTTTAALTESTTMLDTTTQEATGTTEEPRDNHRVHDFYMSKREKPENKMASNISQNLLPLPAGASAALVKPTKYHYYPHNQHIYLLPECAIQQVCNAVYVRLNWTQPLCACPSRYRDPCSASLNSDDQHTTELMTDQHSKRALTLVKTCEPTTEMRICRAPRDWSLLALQNIRTGKSHYLVICRCPEVSILEGPMSHDQPTYASVPGIRVYGMMCVQGLNKRRGRPLRLSRSLEDPPFPWHKANELSRTIIWDVEEVLETE